MDRIQLDYSTVTLAMCLFVSPGLNIGLNLSRENRRNGFSPFFFNSNGLSRHPTWGLFAYGRVHDGSNEAEAEPSLNSVVSLPAP